MKGFVCSLILFLCNSLGYSQVVANYINTVSEISFNFCYNANSSTYSSTNLVRNTTLYGTTTIGGVQASAANATIVLVNPTVLPNFITLNPNGTFNITSSLPFSLNFRYQICSLNGLFCSPEIYGSIEILSPFQLVPDYVVYNTAGVLQGGGLSYNVINNDYRRICTQATLNNFQSLVPSSVQCTGSATTPNYFSIQPNGIILVSNSGSVIPVGTYTLTYTLCDLPSLTVCATQFVYITVGNLRMAQPIISKMSKPIIKNKNATPSIYPPIIFPDPNLKARLLMGDACINLADNDYILVDANNDTIIDTNEALQIGRVNLAQGNITDLAGMEKFTNLKELSALFNNISSCNLVMPNLKGLGIGGSPFLTNVNLSNLPSLECIAVISSSVNTLDISNNPLLTRARFENTLINTIDFGSNPNLSWLTCSNNPNLTSINIKNNSSLDYSNSFMLQDCWVNCPNLTNICADANEIPALQNFLLGCGVSTSGININSACALATTTFDNQAISVSPNPTKSIVTITFKDFLSEKASYEVYNVLGQKVIAKDVSIGINNFDINLENYANGLYLLQITIGDKKFNKSLIKQ